MHYDYPHNEHAGPMTQPETMDDIETLREFLDSVASPRIQEMFERLESALKEARDERDESNTLKHLRAEVGRLERSREDLRKRNEYLKSHDDCDWRHKVPVLQRTCEEQGREIARLRRDLLIAVENGYAWRAERDGLQRPSMYVTAHRDDSLVLEVIAAAQDLRSEVSGGPLTCRLWEALKPFEGLRDVIARAAKEHRNALTDADLDTTTDPQAWRRAGHTCERETLDGASVCPHPSHLTDADTKEPAQ